MSGREKGKTIPMRDAEIKLRLRRIDEDIQKLEQQASDLVAGRKVRILSDYNGQPYGTSRPSLRGKVMTATGAALGGIWSAVNIAEEREPVYLRDVEFVS